MSIFIVCVVGLVITVYFLVISLGMHEYNESRYSKDYIKKNFYVHPFTNYNKPYDDDEYF